MQVFYSPLLLSCLFRQKKRNRDDEDCVDEDERLARKTVQQVPRDKDVSYLVCVLVIILIYCS